MTSIVEPQGQHGGRQPDPARPAGHGPGWAWPGRPAVRVMAEAGLVLLVVALVTGLGVGYALSWVLLTVLGAMGF